MRTRWRILFCSSLITLIGVAWLAQREGTSWERWFNLELFGMMAASGLGFVGVKTETRNRLLAVLVLVCMLPTAQSIWTLVTMRPEMMRMLGAPGFAMISGSLATIGTALYILVVPPPPIPVEPLPRARAA